MVKIMNMDRIFTTILSNGFCNVGTLTRTIRINDRVIKAWADILIKSTKGF